MLIVVKIGTNLLTKEDNSLNEEYISDIASQMAALKANGHDVLLVSSGAATAGRSKLKTKKENKNIPFKQALAAVGQGLLMHTYKKAFKDHNLTIAQALLTNHDFSNRHKYLNILHTLELLLRLDVIPIINENDVTSIKEYAIGENDILAGQLSAMLGADLLIILTTVDGLYTGIPGKDPDAKLITEIEEITSAIKDLAKGPESKFSSGGMITKIRAAEFATQSGVPMIIAGGRKPNILKKIVLDNNPEGTYFPTKVSHLESRKNWLRHMIKKDAALIVDQGAKKALIKDKKSLLAVGIKDLEGTFARGDVIYIKDESGHSFGLGQVNYSHNAVTKIKGHQTKDFPQLLNKSYEEEIINRDQLLILEQ